MIKVMHVITTEVVSLTGILDQAEKMKAIGVRVRTLGMKTSVPNPLLVMRLAQWIRESKPDVIHTWMYHANLVGALAARLAGDIPVVWGIHHSALDPRVDKRRTVLVNRVCAFLSRRFPARIVCCSEASLRIHKNLRYAAEKMEVIPNGFDLEQVIIRAAARLQKQIPQIQFLLCGLDIGWQNSQLVGWIETAGIRACCHLLGVRRDMSRLFTAMDIATTASLSGEAFPLVIGEAMACGTPCVVTDVGDSALIVGETGIVVPPGDPGVLAEAWRRLIEAGPVERRRLGLAARRRVQLYFALPAIVERYQTIYAQLAAGALRGAPSTSLSQFGR